MNSSAEAVLKIAAEGTCDEERSGRWELDEITTSKSRPNFFLNVVILQRGCLGVADCSHVLAFFHRFCAVLEGRRHILLNRAASLEDNRFHSEPRTFLVYEPDLNIRCFFLGARVFEI